MNKTAKVIKMLKQGDEFEVFIEGNIKKFRSENYNYDFDLTNGNFSRWGKTEKDDPKFSPFGPEILDCEITTICKGVDRRLCPYCYKSNNFNGTNMSLETFKKVIEKVNFNQQLTQVAFGLDSQALANPDLWAMCEYLRDNHIIPNGTVAQLNYETAKKIGRYFGGVAVSWHNNYRVFANTVNVLAQTKLIKKFPIRLQQINCHFMICEETYENCLKLVESIKTDERLKDLNAVVLLGLKKCGRAEKGFNRLTDEHFEHLVKLFFQEKIGFGFDSCSANRFENMMIKWTAEKVKAIDEVDDFEVGPQDNRLKAMAKFEEHKKLNEVLQMIEPCESGLFSSYVNVEGCFYPCSFNEKAELKFDVVNGNFQEHWTNGLEDWKLILHKAGRSCPSYEV